ncbi:hypothetical protein A5819_000851 [Enterococcus sp. 7E2_DIV0204]|uniref:C45 family autoproteolytic acyltransferase/hydolase n=1 Tax=unclassified Enterococcus TaxID=2608891 RepID=UPI000A354E01|nr:MULTISPECIES: C45 family peptidase [unclassified Enterococcus]OTN88370.1 hypothetical protein A5819_000851 [Enterococcus sp. 7E2_DIV0204]OTP50841.1 hypothetical protein A5884_000027 [Enterococcus sp. 7D2_DIV0200]
MIHRYIQVTGSAFERGVEIGKILKMQIQTNLSSQKLFYKDPTEIVDKWLAKAQTYLDYTEKFAPNVVAEMEGVAQGSGIDFQEILYLYTIYERSFFDELISDKCTSFAAKGNATLDGSVICGQTNDERLDEYRSEVDCVVHHIDSETDFEALIYSHPGIPAYMGMNNYGLAVMWTYIDNGQRQAGLPTAGIIRELLNKRSLKEAREYLYSIPHAVPNQFSLSHSTEGIASFECFPNKIYEHAPADVMIHANHNSIALEEPEEGGSKTSHSRFEAMEAIVNENVGIIDMELGKQFLANHRNFPKSVCNHPSPEHPLSKSLASMVFDLGKGNMHLAFGNACEQPFHTYQFKQWFG